MDYTVKEKLKDKKILTEILQNKFPRFDDSVVKWKFKNKSCTANMLEKKILTNYSNKIYKPDNQRKVNYLDWINIFDESLKKIKSLNKLPIIKYIIIIIYFFIFFYYIYIKINDYYKLYSIWICIIFNIYNYII